LGPDDLVGEAEGEIEKTDDGVLVIRRIHITYHLRVDPSQAKTVERVHRMHANFCPVYRSLRGSIEIDTAVSTVD